MMCALRDNCDQSSPRGARRPGDRANGNASPHSLKYKAAAFRSPRWKDDFRRRCLDRMKTSRRRMLDAGRPGQEDVREAMDATWREMEAGGNRGHPGGQPRGHGSTLLEDLVPDQITDADVEEYARSVADMEAELSRLVEAAEADNVDEAMGAAMLEVSDAAAVTCPVCKLAALEILRGGPDGSLPWATLACPCGVDVPLPAGTALPDVHGAVTRAVTLHGTYCEAPLPTSACWPSTGAGRSPPPARRATTWNCCCDAGITVM